jgi:hypothetical protein
MSAADLFARVAAAHASQAPSLLSVDNGPRASGSSAVSIASFDKLVPGSYTFEHGRLSPNSSIHSRDQAAGLNMLDQLRSHSPALFQGMTPAPSLLPGQPAPSGPMGDHDDGEDGEGDEYQDPFGIATSRLCPSLREHIIENGRSYHAYKAGKYPWPNDLYVLVCFGWRARWMGRVAEAF